MESRYVALRLYTPGFIGGIFQGRDMSTRISDVLNTSIVFPRVELLNTSESRKKFRELVKSEVLIDEGGIIVNQEVNIPAVSARLFRLAKDRIQIESSQAATTCRIDFPTKKTLSRLVQTTHHAIISTYSPDVIFGVFGFNIDLVYEQFSESSVLEYIARRIFSSPLFSNNNWNLAGGAGRFSFEEEGNSWNVRIEPRLNEEIPTKVFLSVNLHVTAPQQLTKENISMMLEKTWDQAHKLVERIDENVANR